MGLLASGAGVLIFLALICAAVVVFFDIFDEGLWKGTLLVFFLFCLVAVPIGLVSGFFFESENGYYYAGFGAVILALWYALEEFAGIDPFELFSKKN